MREHVLPVRIVHMISIRAMVTCSARLLEILAKSGWRRLCCQCGPRTYSPLQPTNKLSRMFLWNCGLSRIVNLTHATNLQQKIEEMLKTFFLLVNLSQSHLVVLFVKISDPAASLSHSFGIKILTPSRFVCLLNSSMAFPAICFDEGCFDREKASTHKLLRLPRADFCIFFCSFPVWTATVN